MNESARIVALTTYELVASKLHPRVPGGHALRARLARLLCRSVEGDCHIDPDVHLPRELVIRNGAGIGRGAMFLGDGPIVLGRRLKMGPQCMFITNDHPLPPLGRTFSDLQGTTRGITIGDDVFLGARVVVLPGVTIGDRACVAAGAVVTRDIPADTLMAGVPARRLGPSNTGPDAC